MGSAVPVIYYANPSTEAIRDAMSAHRLGCITTPKQGNVTFPDEWDVIADNGCFSAKWDHDRWFRWLLDLPRTVRFAVAPDVFDPDGGPCHDATVERWERYGPLMERHGFTPAFVCQVGCTTYEDVPADARVLFIGGTDEYKLGKVPHEGQINRIAAAAKRDGRWVHCGRVNSLKRFRAARAMGCDSVDGTYLTFGPDVNLPKLLAWLDDAEHAPMLSEVSR
jgi:hypothetical protein